MASIFVSRFGGTKEGRPVTSNLATSVSVLLELGRQALNTNSMDVSKRTVEVPYDSRYRKGMVVATTDGESALYQKGVIRDVTHEFPAPKAVTKLLIEIPQVPL